MYMSLQFATWGKGAWAAVAHCIDNLTDRVYAAALSAASAFC